jgi:hypothetical protein
MDEIVNLLMGEISLEIKTHDEPIFGSGKLIGASNQKDVDLDVEGEGGISKRVYESVVRDLDIEKAEHEKSVRQLKEEKAKVLKELQIEFNRKSAAEKKKWMEEGEELKKKLESKEKELLEIKTTGRKSSSDDGNTDVGANERIKPTKTAPDLKKIGSSIDGTTERIRPSKTMLDSSKNDKDLNDELAKMMTGLGRG